MPRSSATTLALPPFEGTVRRLILANVVVFFAFEIMGWLTPGLAGSLLDLLQLQPFAVAHGALWQLFTYSFLNLSLLGILFGMLTLWFVGPMLEGIYGSRWLAELYFTSAIGGAAIASAISFTHVLHLSQLVWAAGVGAPIFGLLIAIAVRPDRSRNALEGFRPVQRAAAALRWRLWLPLRPLRTKPRLRLRGQRAVLWPAQRLLPGQTPPRCA
jgi:membrane associated rhomboid family serine protease